MSLWTSRVHSRQHSLWQMMVGRLLSFWGRTFFRGYVQLQVDIILYMFNIYVYIYIYILYIMYDFFLPCWISTSVFVYYPLVARASYGKHESVMLQEDDYCDRMISEKVSWQQETLGGWHRVFCLGATILLSNSGDGWLSIGFINLTTKRDFLHVGQDAEMEPNQIVVHPWNLKITQLKRKIIFQTIIFRFHVNLPGCICT